ncbi:hypothetical protein GC209_19250 [bacterium]|nr:hypothetical protein [bacterium]
MLGTYPLGSLPLAELAATDTKGKVLPYALDLESATRALFVVAVVDTYGAEGIARGYYGTVGWTTAPDDNPPDTWIPGVLKAGIAWTVAVPQMADGTWGGLVSRSYGEVIFANPGGDLDALADRAVDGRRVTLRMGQLVKKPVPVPMLPVGDDLTPIAGDAGTGVTGDLSTGRQDQSAALVPASLSAAGVIFETLADSWTFSDTELQLVLQDYSAQLRVPLQTRRYAGTGGIEGPTELEGKTRQLVYGRSFAVPPVLLDAGLQIYEVNDGAILAVDAVRERGVALVNGGAIAGGWDELAAVTVDPGAFVVAPEAGIMRLATVPQGALVCDVRGAIQDVLYSEIQPWDDGTLFSDLTGWSEKVAGPGYAEKLGGVLLCMLGRTAFWDLSRIDRDSFDDFDSGQPAPIGWAALAGSEITLADAIDGLCRGMGALAGPDQYGRFQLRRLEAPQVRTPIVFDEDSTLSLERVPLPYRTAPYQWTIGWQRYWRTQGPSDLAGSLQGTAAGQDLAEEWRQAISGDPTRKIAHPTAKAGDLVQAPFAVQADAAAEAARRFALYAPGRELYRLRTKHLWTRARLGDTVTVIRDRWGLEAGRNMVVLSISLDLANYRTELLVFG